MVGYLPHCTFNLNPRAASIDTPLHAFVPKKHVDHMHPDAIIAIAAVEEQQGADGKRSSATRSAGCRGSGRASSSACGWRNSAARIRRRRGVVLESHGLFTWGDTAKESYETTIRIINRAIEWFESETHGQAGLRRRGAQDAAGGRAPRHRRAADAGDPRHDLGRRAQGRPFRRPARGAGIRRLEGAGAAGRARHQLPRPFPAHQDPAAGGRFRSGQSRCRQDARRPGRARSRNTARAMPPTTSAASTPTARPCATPMRSSIWCRASA